MKLFLLLLVMSIGFIGCSSVDNAYYDRANKANDKAQADLQK